MISPFAAGAPSKDEIPYILDMAPSVVAKGKIRKAARRGEPELRLALEREKQGIPYADAEKKMFDALAEKYGVPALALSSTPLG